MNYMTIAKKLSLIFVSMLIMASTILSKDESTAESAVETALTKRERRKIAKENQSKSTRATKVIPEKETTTFESIQPPVENQKEEVKINDEGNKAEKKEGARTVLPNYAYLGEYAKPWQYVPEDKTLELNFENAELINFIKFVEKEFGINFILDSAISGEGEPAKGPTGIKFSFKTEQPLTKRQAWDIFVSFLDLAGLTVVPGPAEKVFRITANNDKSNRVPIPTYINIDSSFLPHSDIKIRYIYAAQNTSVAVLKGVADKIKSATAAPIESIDEINTIILTDKSASIRSILEVFKELDKNVLPEALTIIKLKKADAKKVADLYTKLATEERGLLSRFGPGARKPSTLAYFTDNVKVVPEPRTNSLIILGPRANAKKIEEFIIKEIDKDIELPYSPLHVYQLKFTDATTVAGILTSLTTTKSDSVPGAQYGGVIGGVRYLKPSVSITADPDTNSLVINADYDDYLQLFDLIQKIDVEQPQVALRVLVLNVDLQNEKAFGIQLRNDVPCTSWSGVLGPNVNFQTSGLPLSSQSFSQIVQNTSADATGATRLLGNLVTLAASNAPGSTLITLGADAFGVWGLLKVLETTTNLSVISKPFLITTNKYTASLEIGETRRVNTANIFGTTADSVATFDDLSASLKVDITPIISPDGLVTLQVAITDAQFTEAADPSTASNPSQGNYDKKQISTTVLVGDRQVLALGGLIRDTVVETEVKVPVLGDIPLVGWFFKNKSKIVARESLLILIEPEIIQPHNKKHAEQFTKQQMDNAYAILCEMMQDEQLQDPIQTLFFEDDRDQMVCKMNNFGSKYREQAAFAAKEDAAFSDLDRPNGGTDQSDQQIDAAIAAERASEQKNSRPPRGRNRNTATATTLDNSATKQAKNEKRYTVKTKSLLDYVPPQPGVIQ